jgi:HD-GYP domain-containing protein (c-di-GMP phosphodiesterase class II)
MSEQQRKVIELASRLHDIGKIGVSDEVLLKAEPLTEADRRHVEEHPVLGERILAPAHLDEILPAVRHHHECWDGSGYPDGLRGPQIPLEARVLCVCDAFEAMTATRSYRPSYSVKDALHEIEQRAGTQFDPDVAAAFARMITHLHGYAARDKAERLGRDSMLDENTAPGTSLPL